MLLCAPEPSAVKLIEEHNAFLNARIDVGRLEIYGPKILFHARKMRSGNRKTAEISGLVWWSAKRKSFQPLLLPLQSRLWKFLEPRELVIIIKIIAAVPPAIAFDCDSATIHHISSRFAAL
jgi:hypothetical protein